MRVHIILRYVGMVLIFNSIFLFISFLISAFNHDTAVYPLLYSTVVTLLFGIFPLIFVPPSMDITNQEGYGLVVLSWLLSCLVGVLPYVLWGGNLILPMHGLRVFLDLQQQDLPFLLMLKHFPGDCFSGVHLPIG